MILFVFNRGHASRPSERILTGYSFVFNPDATYIPSPTNPPVEHLRRKHPRRQVIIPNRSQ